MVGIVSTFAAEPEGLANHQASVAWLSGLIILEEGKLLLEESVIRASFCAQDPDRFSYGIDVIGGTGSAVDEASASYRQMVLSGAKSFELSGFEFEVGARLIDQRRLLHFNEDDYAEFFGRVSKDLEIGERQHIVPYLELVNIRPFREREDFGTGRIFRAGIAHVWQARSNLEIRQSFGVNRNTAGTLDYERATYGEYSFDALWGQPHERWCIRVPSIRHSEFEHSLFDGRHSATTIEAAVIYRF